MRRATVSGTTIVIVQEMTSSEEGAVEPFTAGLPAGGPSQSR